MIPAPWALPDRGQAFLRSCIPHSIPSHTLNLASLLRLLLLSLLLVFLCLHLRREKQGDIHSRPLLYFTAGFSSAVCLLFIRAMLRYYHDNALLKVLLDGTRSFLFVQWFEPFTVVHWPEAKILLPLLCQQLPPIPDNAEAPGAAYGCVHLGTEIKTQSATC